MPGDERSPEEPAQEPDEAVAASPAGPAAAEAGRDADQAEPQPEPGAGFEKKVDEDWKAEARSEKEKIDRKIEEKARKEAEKRAPPPADFLHFVSGIAAQVLMQLGELENPIAGKKVVDLAAARYSIDILQMLEEKTKGNLAPEEERYLSAALHDLRMRFVGEATNQGQPRRHGDTEEDK